MIKDKLKIARHENNLIHFMGDYNIYICGPVYQHELSLIPAWISNTHSKLWDEIIYQFPNFNGGDINV